MKLRKLLVLSASLLMVAGIGAVAGTNHQANADQPHQIYMRLNGRHDRVYYDCLNGKGNFIHSRWGVMPRWMRHRGKRIKVYDYGEVVKKLHHHPYVIKSYDKKVNRNLHYVMMYINLRDFYKLKHGTPYQRYIRGIKRSHIRLMHYLHKHPYAPKGRVYLVGHGRKVTIFDGISLNGSGSYSGGTEKIDTSLSAAKDTLVDKNDFFNDYGAYKIDGQITASGHKFYKVDDGSNMMWIDSGNVSRNIFSKGHHTVDINNVFNNLLWEHSYDPSSRISKLLADRT